MLKTQTLFQTVELSTGTWTIETSSGGEQQVDELSPDVARRIPPVDPWEGYPLASCPHG